MVRHRDQPTVEVTQRVRCDVATAWKRVTDIELPARCSPELQNVEWLARFRGSNQRESMGAWQTECEVVEFDEERRWVWNVVGAEGVTTSTLFATSSTDDPAGLKIP